MDIVQSDCDEHPEEGRSLVCRKNSSEIRCYLHDPESTFAIAYAMQQYKRTAEAVSITIQNGELHRRDPASLEAFLEAVADLPLLKEVFITILQSRRLAASTLCSLIRRSCRLESLKLRDVEIDESPYVLAEALRECHSLKKIHLFRCYCRPVHVLIKAMSTMPHLKEVQIDGTILRQQSDGDALLALRALCRSRSLSKLALVDLKEVGGATQFTAMMEALQDEKQETRRWNYSTLSNQNQSGTGLKELFIDVAPFSSLTVGAAHVLARMISNNSTLVSLHVSWMGGGELLLPIIENGIAFNSTLKEFRLCPGSYHIRNEVAPCAFSSLLCRRVANALRKNTSLTYLWVDSWEEIDTEIDLYLRANQLGRGYLLHQRQDVSARPSHNEWIDTLVASHDKPHLSYYWLTHNPTLLQQH